MLNLAYAALMEGLDQEAIERMDRIIAGKDVEPISQEEAFMRARGRRPRQGAPASARAPGQPPPMPEGYALAPVGVQVREPEPTRGLEHLHAALEKAR